MTNIDFIAIDFETADYHMNSACSVGIAVVDDLQVVETYYSLIKPPSLSFHPKNVAIHGITPEMVKDAPSFDALWPEIRSYFTPHCPVVAHNAPFDMSVLHESLTGAPPDFPFVDSIALAGPLVPGSKSLAHCAETLHIDLEHHHNAAADAVACAKISICALQAAGCISMWEFLAKQPQVSIRRFRDFAPMKTMQWNTGRKFPSSVSPSSLQPAAACVDRTHPLFGKAVVFTGELTLDRKEAMQMAVNAGALVKSSVTRKTDYLVVGRQDRSLVGESGVSTKEARAQALIAEGCPITVIGEEAFLALIKGNALPV